MSQTYRLAGEPGIISAWGTQYERAERSRLIIHVSAFRVF